MTGWPATVGEYLVAQSGHLVLLFAIVWLACRWLLPRTGAHWRYLLWLLVLVKCVVPPFLQVVWPEPVVQAVAPLVEHGRAVIEAGNSIADAGELGAALQEPGHIAGFPVLQIVMGAWLAGTTVFLGGVLWRAARVQRNLRRHRTEPDLELECEFVRLAQLSGLRSRPQLCLIVGISQPFVWGLARGCIYLPMHFSSQGTVEQRRLVLAHELAHVVRWDALANSLQILVQAIFWFHPLVWWLNRELRHEREKCCDEMAVALMKVDSRTYGNALIERVAAYFERACPSSSLAISGRAKDLEDRVRALLIPGRSFRRGPTLAAIITVLALGSAFVPAGFTLTTQAPLAAATSAGNRLVPVTLGDEGMTNSGIAEFEGLQGGEQTLAGIPFLVGDAVSLAQGPLMIDASPFAAPKEVHLLHGLRSRREEGTVIATVRWAFVDGTSAQTDLRYGEHVRALPFWTFEPVTDAASTMAWTGSNTETRRLGGSLRLYRTRLLNPHPERTLRSWRIESAEGADPLVVALTLELEAP